MQKKKILNQCENTGKIKKGRGKKIMGTKDRLYRFKWQIICITKDERKMDK